MNIPQNIKALLENRKLCAMATCWEDKPYLSLMNFTYIEAENKIILSSRKNSKKYFNIQKNNRISLLLFSDSNELSVTFLGNVISVSEQEEKHYRTLHMKKNNMPQFILGENIGLIVFDIEKIVVSDKQDKVTYFN